MIRPRIVRFLLLPLSVLAAPLAAQQGGITGMIRALGTPDPVSGVEVTISGAGLRRTVVSRQDGRYTIAAVPPGTYSVEARRIGYAFKVAPNIQVMAAVVTLDLELSPISFQLEEIVVTGVTDPTAGVKVPFTVAKVTTEDLPVSATNAFNSLQGKVPGVNVITNPEPGSGVNILLRTPTSINKGNAPLFVVDGVVLSSSFTGSTTDLSGLDIESIEVVKGAAASSLYGSRAAAGVIQIRTSRGRDVSGDRTRVVLRTELGSNAIANPIEFSNQHIYLTNDAGDWVDASGNVVPREQRVLKPAATRFQDTPFKQTYDNFGTFFDAGSFNIVTLSVAQNNGTTNFFASLSQEGSSGILLDAGDYRRRDLRVNLDHKIRSNIQLGVSAYHMRSSKDDIYEDAFFDLVQTAPDVDLGQPDPDGTPYIFQPDQLGVRPNPLYILSTEENETDRTRTLASVEARWSPLDWLTTEGLVSYDRSDRLISEYLPRGKRGQGSSAPSIGRLRRADGATQAINASLNLSFLKQWGDLTGRASVRGLIERETSDFFDAEGTDLSVKDVPDLNTARNQSLGQTFSEIQSDAWITSAGVDYAGKYILEGLVRRDGSSLFGTDERYNTYYRVSAAWRVAEESWWPVDWLSEFKLRASQGTAGNRPNFADQYETYTVGEAGILSKETLGNPALKPEQARETELGLDLIAWNRLSVQVSAVSSKVTDQLLLVPLRAVYGFTGQWQNAGTVEGTTWEASLQAELIRGRDFGWTAGLVFDRSRHEVTEFNQPCFRVNVISYRCVGETLGTMYGQTLLTSPDQLPAIHANSRDAFQLNDEGLLVPVGPGATPEDMLWGTTVTIDGRSYAWGLPIFLTDSVNNPAVVRIGDSNPDANLGFSTTLRWKGLSVYGLLSTQLGGQVYNRTKQRMFQNQRSIEQDQGGRPQELKKTNEYYNRLYNSNNVQGYFIESAEYLKLRELAVRYRMTPTNAAFLKRVGIQGLTLGLVGRNLFNITGYTGYDPEVGTPLTRFDDFVYPQYRTITGSIEIEF